MRNGTFANGRSRINLDISSFLGANGDMTKRIVKSRTCWMKMISIVNHVPMWNEINAYAHNYMMIRLQLCHVNPIINPIMGV